jgi:hypothetical protein
MKKALMLTTLFVAAAGLARAQTLEVIAPNGGEILVSGTPVTIAWSFSGLNAGENLLISLEGSADYGPIAYCRISSGSYEWIAGRKMDGTFAKPAGGYRILIELVGSDQGHDASNGAFTISPAPSVVALMAPNGGETLQKGSDFSINWSCSGQEGFVSLLLLKDEQPLGLIAENLPAASLHYVWHVGARLLNGVAYASGSTYRIQIQWQLAAVTGSAVPGVQPATTQGLAQNTDRSERAFAITGMDEKEHSKLVDKKR